MDILETVEEHTENYYRIFEGLYNGMYLFELKKIDNVK